VKHFVVYVDWMGSDMVLKTKQVCMTAVLFLESFQAKKKRF
jgi:hypothetical protein